MGMIMILSLDFGGLRTYYYLLQTTSFSYGGRDFDDGVSRLGFDFRVWFLVFRSQAL
jgi:hypothetical protein